MALGTTKVPRVMHPASRYFSCRYEKNPTDGDCSERPWDTDAKARRRARIVKYYHDLAELHRKCGDFDVEHKEHDDYFRLTIKRKRGH